MKLTGLHFLLTMQCTFECDHCFVWGSPWQNGVIPLADIRLALEQAKAAGTVGSVYFEGGEPFLYYGLLLKAVQDANEMGFEVGIVSNGYWATGPEDAIACLRPFAGLLSDLTLSSDLFHYSEKISQQVQFARQAARQLGIPVGVITIARPDCTTEAAGVGQIPQGEGSVMYRGRATEKMAAQSIQYPWEGFTTCPHEDLREPGRVHLDPFGNLHICQGIVIGNIKHASLKVICETYEPEQHAIIGPLLSGGPAELARRYGITPDPAYADACHLCYSTRMALRSRFPDLLGPDGMYGEYQG